MSTGLWRVLRPTIAKDTQLLLRDRGTLLSLFLLPLVFVMVFGSLFGKGIDEQSKARTLAVFHEGDDASTRVLIEGIEQSGMFKIDRKDSAQELHRWVAKDASRVGLVITGERGGLAQAQLVIDTASPMRFRAPIEGAMRRLVEMPSVPLPGPTLAVVAPQGIRVPATLPSGFQLSVPGNAVLFGFFLALTMALSLIEERRTGTWRRLLAAPVSRPPLLIAKLVPYYLIGLVQMVFLFGAGAIFFDMQVAGSVLALAVLTLITVFAAVALGLLIASLGGNEKQVGSVGSIALLIMGLLGGAMIPRVSMPEAMQTLGLATPHAWALDGYYDLLVRPGSGVADVWPDLAAVAAFGVVFLLIGSAMFRFED